MFLSGASAAGSGTGELRAFVWNRTNRLWPPTKQAELPCRKRAHVWRSNAVLELMFQNTSKDTFEQIKESNAESGGEIQQSFRFVPGFTPDSMIVILRGQFLDTHLQLEQRVGVTGVCNLMFIHLKSSFADSSSW